MRYYKRRQSSLGIFLASREQSGLPLLLLFLHLVRLLNALLLQPLLRLQKLQLFDLGQLGLLLLPQPLSDGLPSLLNLLKLETLIASLTHGAY